MHVCMYVCCECLCGSMLMHVYKCLKRPEEGIRFPDIGVINGYEPPDVGGRK